MSDMNQNVNPETGEKTFTQEQVNAIVGKRLAEAKASSEAALNKREQELNQREMQIRAKELLVEKGLPKSLAEVLKYDDEESLKAAIDVIEHTRGFENSETNEQNEPPHKRIIENILPSGKADVFGDPLRKAMGLK